MQKTTEQWIAQGKRNCKSYVFYENLVLDMSGFMGQHPGGIKAIKNYVFKDITNIIFEVYPHPKETTHRTLLKYQVGYIPKEEAKQCRNKNEKLSQNDSNMKSKKKVYFGQEQNKKSSQPHKNPPQNQIKNSGRSKQQSLLQQSNRTYKTSKTNKTNKTSNTNRTSKSKSKVKKPQPLTSIRIIEDKQNKTYDEYYQENKNKIQQKLSNDFKKPNWSQSCISNDKELDEEKPNFKIPVFQTKLLRRPQQ